MYIFHNVLYKFKLLALPSVYLNSKFVLSGKNVWVCLCVYSSEPACPLTGCVRRGPRPPSVGGPEAAVALLKARHVTCSWARASCAAWSGSPGTWAAGRGEDGDEDRKQEAAQVSSLSSVANRTGEKARPFPPLTAGAIIHHHICQSENMKL